MGIYGWEKYFSLVPTILYEKVLTTEEMNEFGKNDEKFVYKFLYLVVNKHFKQLNYMTTCFILCLTTFP